VDHCLGGVSVGRALAIRKSDGWMDGWMDGWIDGSMDGCIGGDLILFL